MSARVSTGRVVDAVAHEGEVAARGIEDALDLLDLIAGEQLGVVLVKAELLGHGVRDLVGGRPSA